MLSHPERLTPEHDLASFECGQSALDTWLRRRAVANQASGASKTYVVCAEKRVVGYYCLATGAVRMDEAPGRIKNNMPDPIPMILLGRLAIDISHQRAGLGRLMLRDAIQRTTLAASIVGIRGIFVHALSEAAKAFYQKAGFHESPVHPMLLMISMKEAEAAMERGR